MGMRVGLRSMSASQLEALRQDPDAIWQLAFPPEGMQGEDRLDLGKAWHGLHYLLTGTAWGVAPPLGLAILGGEDIGPEMDYGPARFVAPPQVAEVAAALAALSGQEVARRYDPQVMDAKQIYPTQWAGEGAAGLDGLGDIFSRLATFYAGAAARGDSVLHWIA